MTIQTSANPIRFAVNGQIQKVKLKTQMNKE